MNPSKRRARLQELIGRMNNGYDISTRDIKIVLTDEEHDEFIQMWDAEKGKRTAEKPLSVKDYEKLLNQWHMAEARVQRYRNRQNKVQATLMRMSNDVDTHLERIQECLLERQGDSEFNLWLDRHSRHQNSNDAINPESPSNSLYTPPLVVTSRSHHKQSNGFIEKLSKRDIKLIVLEQAFNELDSPSALVEFKILGGQGIDKDKFKGFKF
jgi:hypothetical protein